MSSQPFIAIIKRYPGGKGYKHCRNIQLDSIPNPLQNSCIPPQGGAENLRSYLIPWPKRITSFMNYGTTSNRIRSERYSSIRDHQLRMFSSSSSGSKIKTSKDENALNALKDSSDIHQMEDQSVYGSMKKQSASQESSSSLKGDGSKTSSPSMANEIRPQVTLRSLKNKYNSGEPITMVTAYDHSGGFYADMSGIDMILVGDSLSMVMLGHDSTAPVTMDQMITHTQAVRRGVKSSFVVADLPFGSYLTTEDALKNSSRFVKEAGADAIKLEGGRRVLEKVKAMVDAGFVVIGHIGLTPQTSTSQGGFVLQGKSLNDANDLVQDAIELQKAGCAAIVLEMVPHQLADYITRNLSIPTIGIGAGNKCSGQVLVYHDLLGLTQGRKPKLCKRYVDLGSIVQTSLAQYREEVIKGEFPSNKENAFAMQKSTLEEFIYQQKEIHPEFNFDIDVGTKSSLPPKSSEPSKRRPKRIVVVGGGAMGSLFATKLSQNSTNSQDDIWLLSGWKDHVNKINQDGITIKEAEEKIVRVKATSDPHEIIKNGKVDVVIALVKGPGTQAATEKIKVLLPEPDQGMVITLQNGIGGLDILKKNLGASRCFGGFTSHACTVKSPGEIHHTGIGNTTIILPDLPKDSPRYQEASEFAEILTESGISIDLIEANNPAEEAKALNAIWTKLITNAVINPLTAIFNVKNGEIARNKEFIPLIVNVLEEIITVAGYYNLQIDTSVKKSLEKVLETAKATEDNISSMLSDIKRGSQTEISFINGYLVEKASRFGLDMPYNSALVNIVQMLEEERMDRDRSAKHIEDVARRNSHVISTLLAKIPTSSGLFDLYQRSHGIQSTINTNLSRHISTSSNPKWPIVQCPTISNIRQMITESVRDIARSERVDTMDVSVGLVPTMGALHSGHIQLVEKAMDECDVVVVSIFVNEKQFAAGEDFDKYPRNVQKDIEILSKISTTKKAKKLFVFTPNSQEMYPFENIHRTYVKVEDIDSQGGEGKSRPGFFRGVATVCTKLFNIIQPKNVYFGQKDGQQCIIIKKMIRDLNFAIDMKIVETIRESDGLAMSSRNVYLSQVERDYAPIIYKALQHTKATYSAAKTIQDLKDIFSVQIQPTDKIHPEILYISICDMDSGEEISPEVSLDEIQQQKESSDGDRKMLMMSVGVRIGSTRLIDNVIIRI